MLGTRAKIKREEGKRGKYKIGSRMDISEVREVLCIRHEGLTENLETYGIDELWRREEKKRAAA